MIKETGFHNLVIKQTGRHNGKRPDEVESWCERKGKRQSEADFTPNWEISVTLPLLPEIFLEQDKMLLVMREDTDEFERRAACLGTH